MTDREAHEAGFRNGWIVKCLGRDVEFFTTRKKAEEYLREIQAEKREAGFTIGGALSRGSVTWWREEGLGKASAILKKVVDGKAQFV